MKFMDKLKDIIFDEVTVEIPVITKEDEDAYDRKKAREADLDDDVVITKVESKPTRVDGEMFDMPKFNDEEGTTKKSNFTFPVFDDDEDEEELKEEHNNKFKEDVKPSRGYDYLSSTSFKADSYTESRNNQYTNGGKKPFTLSPIISPVYGILNENYKKEDITVKDSSNLQYKNNAVDFDTVRKKAYGTLEDEIEDKLVESKSDVLDELPERKDYTLEALSDDGLSVSDLLIDEEDDIKDEVFSATQEINVDDIENEEIEIDEEEPKKEEKKEDLSKEDLNKEEGDDLFDLIDSLYEGKEDNN